MKRIFILLSILCINYKAFCQRPETIDTVSVNSVTIGLLEGGGSIAGIDFEKLLSHQFGFQLGFGLVGFGAGIDFHIKPTIRSSFISLQYWHQGFGETYTQSLLGPNYVFRGKRWFTCQLGCGFVVERGPAWPDKLKSIPVMLTYAIGAYIPW